MDHNAQATRYLENMETGSDIDPMAMALVHALLAMADALERIDDALRNTVGGRP